jgi:glycosyltransferase involved in cell wall biosynthesis
MVDLTAIILTLNEEMHIERSVRSAKEVAKYVLVVDSFSSDRTVEIACSLGANVVQREFKNQADQFQWALDHCTMQTDWVLRLDADEYLEPSLVSEIRQKLPVLPGDVDGIYMKRKAVFMGRWIRHGGVYPLILLRIWRKGKGRVEQRWMDEHIVLPPGAQTVIAEGHLVDDNRKGITFWIDKHNKFASREMVDLLNIKYPLFEKDEGLKAVNDPQAKRKRIIKDHIYSKLPVGLRALLYFFYRYFLRLGFLDGRTGLIYHFMQGFWYRFLVDLKLMEIEKLSGGDFVRIKKLIKEKHGIEI